MAQTPSIKLLGALGEPSNRKLISHFGSNWPDEPFWRSARYPVSRSRYAEARTSTSAVAAASHGVETFAAQWSNT
jgi:hypothetical protein